MPDSSFQHCDAFDLLKNLDIIIGTVDVKSLLVFYLFDLESAMLSHYGILLQRERERWDGGVGRYKDKKQGHRDRDRL